ASLRAQHPATIPEMYTGSFATSSNALPLGRTKAFIQYFIDGKHVGLRSPIVSQIGWRRASTTVTSPAATMQLEIVLGATSATFSTLSTTFAANFTGTPTPFLALKALNFPAFSSATTDPDVPALWIRGDRPYIHTIGSSLIIQVDNQSSPTAGSLTGWNSDSILGGSTTSAIITSTDASCGGQLTTSYAAGSVSLSVSGAQPNLPVVYLLGLHLAAPFDFGAIFGPTCTAVVLPDITIGVAANAAGQHSFSFPLTTPVTETLVVHFQAIHLFNNQLVTTNATHMSIGNAGLCNYLYNWTTFGPTAQYGPYTTNRGPVHLIR
nr:hypothetical protein [Planctomycetota bacterium]